MKKSLKKGKPKCRTHNEVEGTPKPIGNFFYSSNDVARMGTIYELQCGCIRTASSEEGAVDASNDKFYGTFPSIDVFQDTHKDVAVRMQ